MPGPVCYDLGGEHPTVTDSNLILGYINPEHLIGGDLKLKSPLQQDRSHTRGGGQVIRCQ